ncbi:ATP-binding cassette domain-containing protein [Conexibacter sp. JD483]|uniref:amino acid ABC transporter ATP-binding/permease protein n=1 Tax=unclassified Conexibacter TaxID=2627773 RepID=UPI00271E7397|nr:MULTISPECIES: ATP-binding cassette domain-containing protein [unclassified Conexibacter]MDO8186953.1 ATP-binding cassette domain-containing protein [Conexibacter sp. CPCC 205706]MDO8200592.1 ATP-binding cassette domain-containing protein [Conexibacter sp. CPCC 205762]MDR9368830.1 ATP-binding cassette domain-containing protein [Conexibacter sp. JD483]
MAEALLRTAALVRPRRGRFAATVALGAGALLAGAALLMTSGMLISRAALRPEVLSLLVVIVAVRGFGMARALLRYWERVVSHDLAFRVLADLRLRCFRRLAPLVPGDLRGVGAGELLTRFVADVDQLQHLYLRALAPPLVALVAIVCCAVAAALLLPAAGVVLAAALLLAAVLVPLLTARAAAGAARRQGAARAALTSELVEAIEGGAELAVAGRADDRRARLRGADAELSRLARSDARAGALAVGLGTLLAGAGAVAVLLVAIPAVSDGSLDGVWLAALALLALAAFEAVEPLGGAARHLHACSAAATRLEQLMATEPRVQDPLAPVPIPPRATLELHAATVVLPGAPSAVEDEHDCGACAGDCGGPGDGRGHAPVAGAVLDRVSLRLSPGERVVLVGPSGAGKTTLARLAARLIDPDGGQVTLGGVDLRAATQEQVRSNVLTITQDARIFTTTVRENVLLAARGADASRGEGAGGDTEVAAALTAAGLGDWLATLPHGLDTLVGEDGAQLSGGERQRLLLARALISDVPLLVLDEPTAHLDPATARAVLQDLDAAAGDRGLLLITHDPALVPRADRVLELRGGRLTELTTTAASVTSND